MRAVVALRWAGVDPIVKARTGMVLAGRGVGLLAIAVVGAAGCNVYDATLLDPLEGTVAPPSGAAGAAPVGDVCGDSIVGVNEICDTGIAPGAEGACPTDCGPPACPVLELVGGGCQVECVVATAPCPTSTAMGGCGDGVVDAAAGETCEPGTAQDCPTACDDDDPCTTVAMTGSAATCDVACTTTPVAVMDGDGCCPSGATPDDDGDCMMTPEQTQCLAVVDSGDACARCACLSCTSQSLTCLDGADATANTQCEAVVACSRTNACRGDACYCGADLTTCTTMPAGPCATEIDTAANGMDTGTAACAAGNPLGDAVAVGACTDTNCAAECGTRSGTSSCAP